MAQLQSFAPGTFQSYMQNKKPNYLTELEKRSQELQSKITRTGKTEEKPTFTIQPAKQMNFGAPMSGPGITNFQDYKATLPTQQPTTQKSSGFSLIPQAQAEGEMQWDEKDAEAVRFLIGNGFTQEQALQKVVEYKGQTQPIQTEQENLPGFDLGVKASEGLANIGKGLKFEAGNELVKSKNPFVSSFGNMLEAFKFAGNIPGDTIQLVGELGQAISNPIGTAKSVKTLAEATIETGLNKIFGTDVYTSEDKREMIDGVSQVLKENFGSMEAIQKTIIENPTDVLLSIQGGLQVAKQGIKNPTTIAKIDQINEAISPINILKTEIGAVKGAIKGVGKGTGELGAQILGKTTGTSAETIKTAFKQGGTQEFSQALKGQTTPQDILGGVKQGLEEIRVDKNKLYGQGAKVLQESKKEIPLNDIQKNLLDTITDDYKVRVLDDGKLDFSQSKITGATSKANIQSMYDDLINWRDKTPDGLDTLKQRIQDYYRGVDDSGKADRLSTILSNKIKDKIIEQVPEYKSMVSNYEKVTNDLRDITKTLSLGKDIQTQTALTKLNSILRDNFTARQDVVKLIEQYTGRNIQAQVAGASLNPMLAKGLAGVITGGGIVFGQLTNPAFIAGLATASPRLIGQIAKTVGVTTNKMSEFITNIKKYVNPNTNSAVNIMEGGTKTKPLTPLKPNQPTNATLNKPLQKTSKNGGEVLKPTGLKGEDVFREIVKNTSNNLITKEQAVKQLNDIQDTDFIIKKGFGFAEDTKGQNAIKQQIERYGQSFFDGRGYISTSKGYEKPTSELINNLPDFAKKEYIKMFPSIKEASKTGGAILNKASKLLPSNFKEKAQDFVEGVAENTGARTKLLPKKTPTINKSGFIDFGAIGKSIKEGASKIEKSLKLEHYDEAKKMYTNLVNKGTSPLKAQQQVVAKYGRAYWKVSKAGTLGGVGAKQVPTNLEKAKNMAQAGKSADEIWEKTGWEKGADGKWRFEIDDSKITLNDKIGSEYNGTKFINEAKIADFINHDELFKQYPELKNGKIGQIEIGNNGNNTASFYMEGKTPVISGSFKNIKDAKSYILHELQHGIQELEGFAKGGAPENLELKVKINGLNNKVKELNQEIDWYKLSKQEDKLKEATKKVNNIEKEKSILWNEYLSDYKSLAGETEARNVQSRLLKTPQERKLLRPEKTEDVPRSKQIVKMDGGKAMLSKQVSKPLDNTILKRYSGNSDDFNKPARQGIINDNIKRLDTYINENSDNLGVIYRGLNPREGGNLDNMIKNIKQGNILDKGYMTASKKIEDAKIYTGKDKILLEINNSKGVEIPKNISPYGDEGEIIMPRNTELKYIGEYNKDGFRIIKVEPKQVSKVSDELKPLIEEAKRNKNKNLKK